MRNFLLVVFFSLIIFFSYSIFIEKRELNLPVLGVNVTPTQIITPTTVPVSIKDVKAECVKKVFEGFKKEKKEELTNSNLHFGNQIYRICLAQNGLAPEDLFSDKSETTVINTIQENTKYVESSVDDSYCQQRRIDYQSCLSEYNAKMSEYAACEAQSNNPTSSYKRYCFKPISFCSKPYC